MMPIQRYSPIAPMDDIFRGKKKRRSSGKKKRSKKKKSSKKRRSR